MVTDTREQVPCGKAVQRLKKQRAFRDHVLTYVLVNALLAVIWAITHVHGLFWSVFPMVGWGIVVINAWDAYWRPEIT